MATILKQSYIHEILSRLSASEISVVNNIVNGVNIPNLKQVTLEPHRFNTISENDKGVSYVRICLDVISATFVTGILCYVDDLDCCVIGINGTNSEQLDLVRIYPNKLKFEFLDEGLDTEEIRRELLGFNVFSVEEKKILHELIYDGSTIKDEEGDVLTFADIKSLLDSPYDYVYINDLTNHCMLNFGAYEDDALWFNSRYKIDGANNFVRLIINSQNQLRYDVDEMLVQHIINVTTTTAVGTWKYQLQFNASKSLHFALLSQVANYLYSTSHNLRVPVSGTYTENNTVYLVVGVEAISASQLRIEMYKASDGTYKTIDTGAVDVIDTIL